ncbi:unnamed protein product [Leptidea sinapis]|uniref:Protein kinase domain-containing protein n=1 Tax=Leptidea sinapis TaxID=189913 RepID=A0A5E4R0R0_9NEOP|nr:unnamed protein product [Leptidea sinapis]
MLKTQGVRRCLRFMNKICTNLLQKVYMTLQEPQAGEETIELGEKLRDEKKMEEKDSNIGNIYELRRYGCWSPECRALRLPSYRNHFLLLSCICMEAIHDYLAMRVHSRPDQPSCLTIKQQYLSYLRKMSVTEPMSRSQLSAEWSFASRLAARFYLVREMFACELKRRSFLPRHVIYVLCREAQNIYVGSREAALQAAQWARALAARMPPRHRRYKPLIFNSLMSLRDCLVKHTEHILVRSNEDHGEVDLPKDVQDSLASRVRELLLQIFKLNFELHREMYIFVQAPFLEQRAARARRLRPSSLQPYRERPELPVKRKRPETVLIRETCNPMIHRELHRMVAESARTPCAAATRGVSGGRRVRLLRADSVGEEEPAVLDDHAFRSHRAQNNMEWLFLDSGSGSTGTQGEALEWLLSDSGSGSTETQCEAPEEVGEQQAQWAGRVARSIIEFARCWMTFAVEHCDRGRGVRPRWASQGLDFLMLACDPYNTKYLSDEDFEELKTQMDGCISHVIGSRLATPSPTAPHRQRHRLQVYTVVNTESGQVLAMKELNIGAGDRRALQRAANELAVLQGVVHPHLVRYYGCELHRLCVEGSLEALVLTSGALAEHTTRRYTKQLVAALRELHGRSIAHRDVKSGNIFLTNDGHCLKLGDFGCAVKIRANTTAPGELQGFVGTQAYMAPEVFMKSSGHGRAADIWSLGCVVTEMASGKRPFPEYDSNYQIMFVVGMGGRPHVKSDDDCKCEPGFMIQAKS